MLKFAILGFLNYQSLSGYDLKRQLQASTAHFWHAGLNQVYMTLKNLESDGLVISELQEQEKRPDKRIYTITENGSAELQTWLAEPVTQVEPGKSTLLLKLFFARPAGKAAILAQLQVQLAAHQRQAREYTGTMPVEAREMLASQPELGDDSILWGIVRDFGARYEAMMIAWLEESLRTIETHFPEDV
ncbi:MAG: PadR family transcriptional regulator [Anaerolineaceae bacterium]|nr:PadR family transcriptional regulator [Anaerolineaceae bacterium]